MSSAPPLVSVLLAVHDGERFVRLALESVLRQSFSDLELVVVDDGSTDATADVLAGISDPRLVRLRNDERMGLAASLNRGLEVVRGRYVARLDSDDVALRRWLERQLRELRERPDLAIVGAGVVQVDELGRAGALHLLPRGRELRWHALFSSPFLHNTVVLERAVLESHGLRYDSSFSESEDYELWTRLLALAGGDNVQEALVLHRIHSGRATVRHGAVQREFQLRVALREIARLAPGLTSDQVELAWRVGSAGCVPAEELERAVSAFVDLAEAFESRHGPGARGAAAAVLVRLVTSAPWAARARILGEASRLDPAVVVRGVSRRAGRVSAAPAARREAERWLAELEISSGSRPIRVAAVFPEPTPYRAPLLDRISDEVGLELTVIYAAETVADRTWEVEPRHEAVFLRGLKIPGAERLIRHDYPVTPNIARALAAARPDVVVASGWSTFAAQAAIAWSRLRRVPYALVVESHDEDERPTWRRAIKGAVVPPVVKGASGVLVTGSLARRSMIARGADPRLIWIFANTIDVDAFARRAAELAPERAQLRERLGVAADDVLVLSVARLVPDKGTDSLLRAIAQSGDARLVLVLAGDGPERERLDELARELGVRLVLAGDRPWEQISELYAAADVFALLSRREPWGVVVNEAAASGLPLLLSDHVGAARDLLLDGENGYLVPTDDVTAVADALERLAADPALREAFGARSREIARDWGYEPSIAGFLAAVRGAARTRS